MSCKSPNTVHFLTSEFTLSAYRLVNICLHSDSLWGSGPCAGVCIRWGSFESREGIYKDVMMPRAYEMALNTWSQWLEIHVNRSKTELFFVSMSPTHERYVMCCFDAINAFRN